MGPPGIPPPNMPSPRTWALCTVWDTAIAATTASTKTTARVLNHFCFIDFLLRIHQLRQGKSCFCHGRVDTGATQSLEALRLSMAVKNRSSGVKFCKG